MKHQNARLVLWSVVLLMAMIGTSCAAPAVPTTAPAAVAPTAAPAEPTAAPAAVTLKVAWMGADYKAYADWKQQFEAENPGVTVEYQLIPFAEGPTVYNTMIEGGNTPDLGYLFMGMIAEYAERNAIEPLDSYMSAEDKANWVPAGLDAGTYKGQVYGVPLIAANRTLYVRPDLMEKAGYTEPPKTWDEVKDLAVKMNNPPEVYGFCIGAGRPKHLMQEQISMMWGYGANFFDADGKLSLNTPQAIEYVDSLTSMYTKDEVMPPSVMTLNANECYAEMAAGKVAMMFSMPNQTQMCADNNLECVPIPLPEPQPGGEKRMLLIVDLFGIFQGSQHKDLAYKFIQLVQRPENRLILDKGMGLAACHDAAGRRSLLQLAADSGLRGQHRHPETDAETPRVDQDSRRLG